MLVIPGMFSVTDILILPLMHFTKTDLKKCFIKLVISGLLLYYMLYYMNIFSY